ncbi:hypothetical protein JXA88_14265 [Candidatus Fermentibacteria bacterium]|nr:hypothetical protein [Candidatus Fermentibacteria bacterium]
MNTLTALLVALALSASPARAVEWLIQRVDSLKQFSDMGDRHLRLDSSLHPHVVYGKDHLYHAWFDGTSWNDETVDPENLTGLHASLAIGDDGALHISYAERGSGGLRYAVNRGDAWTMETVDAVVGHSTSLALTSSGIPCITYHDDHNDDLRYAHREASGWVIETVDTNGNVGRGPSLVLDAGDHPHISYCELGNNLVKYAWNDGSGWAIQIADVGDDWPTETSLAMGNDGSVHIAFLARFSLEPDACVLKYAFRPGPADPWQTDNLGFVNDEAASASIVLDQSGVPHVAFLGDGDLKLAYKDEAGWHIEPLYAPGYGGDSPSLVIEGGTLHASFYELNVDALYYLVKTPESTSAELVDAEGSAGQGCSIAISSSNYPSLSYHFDELVDGLKYAWEDGTGWHTEIVDTTGMSGFTSSLALNAAGHAHIAYSEGLQDDLRYARKAETGWSLFTVDSEGNVGHWVSLALDADGFPHISYGDWTWDHSMKYAYEDGGGWHTETFDDASMVGDRNSIALDSNGRPHVVYVPFATVELLKYAWRDESAWHIEVIEPGQFQDASIAVDAAGIPHVCFTAWENSALVYARRIDGAWHKETVEEGVSMLSSPSITLDVAGFPHIGYSRTTPHLDLRYAFKDGLGWHLLTADPDGYSMWSTDVALDDFGIPHMCYYRPNMEDLIYVRMVPPPYLMMNWELLDGSLHLTWIPSPQAAAYWVYGAANHPHFSPGPAPGYEYRLTVLPPDATSWITTDSPGNPLYDWTYLILAMDGANGEVARSVRVGEGDFELTIP